MNRTMATPKPSPRLKPRPGDRRGPLDRAVRARRCGTASFSCCVLGLVQVYYHAGRASRALQRVQGW